MNWQILAYISPHSKIAAAYRADNGLIVERSNRERGPQFWNVYQPKPRDWEKWVKDGRPQRTKLNRKGFNSADEAKAFAEGELS